MVALNDPPEHEGLPHWVIYDHPSDYPDEFVCRRCWIKQGGKIEFEKDLLYRAATIEEVRRELLRDFPGVFKYPGKDPDPHIAEVWI